MSALSLAALSEPLYHGLSAEDWRRLNACCCESCGFPMAGANPGRLCAFCKSPTAFDNRALLAPFRVAESGYRFLLTEYHSAGWKLLARADIQSRLVEVPCPEGCDNGWVRVRTGPQPWAQEVDVHCATCNGSGKVEALADEP